MRNRKRRILLLSSVVFIIGITVFTLIIYVIKDPPPIDPADVDFAKINTSWLVGGESDFNAYFNADIISDQSILEIITIEKYVKEIPRHKQYLLKTTWKIHFEYHMKNGKVKSRKYTGQINSEELTIMLASIPEIAEKMDIGELKRYFGDEYERPEK